MSQADDVTYTDADLVALLRAGDEEAIAQLVERWSPTMLRLARSFVDSRQSAEDVVQEAWLGMLGGLAALTAFGLYRFHQILGSPVLTDPDLRSRVKHLERLVAAAFLQEYREIFLIAVGLCVLAAIVIAFSLAPRRTSGGT